MGRGARHRRCAAAAAADPKPAPAATAKTSRGAISLIKAADHRILALEAELKRREGQLAELEQQLGAAQVRRGSKMHKLGLNCSNCS